MIKLGWYLTFYVILSWLLFLFTAPTILGWIAFFFVLPYFYGILLLCWWIFVHRNRNKNPRVKPWIWVTISILQLATILTAPGSCFGVKQGDRCYSNIQYLLSPDKPHWTLVEDAFWGFLLAYCIAVCLGFFRLSFVQYRSEEANAKLSTRDEDGNT